MDILDLPYSDFEQILIWLPTVLLTLLVLLIIVTTLWIFFPLLFLIMINRLGKINRQLARLIEIKEKELKINADEPSALVEKKPKKSASDQSDSIF